MKSIGDYIVEQARSDYEAGYGEEGGDNRGPWILKIMRGWLGAWCTGWVSYKIAEAVCEYYDDNNEALPWIPAYTRSARNLYNQFKAAGKLVTIPRPGDIVFMSRKGAPWMGHAGIVICRGLISDSIYPNWVNTIQGNVGKFPAKLKAFSYLDYAKVPGLLGYGRIG
jgi:hypothetical protein